MEAGAIGRLVKHWRRAAGWKQDALARRAGLNSQSTVSQLERGAIDMPGGMVLLGLAQAFNTTADHLLAAADALDRGESVPLPAPRPRVAPGELDPQWVADFTRLSGRLSERQRDILLALAQSLAEEAAAERAAELPEQARPQRVSEQRFNESA